MRVALKVSKKDRLSIEELCDNTGIPSVNELAVETTLLECWRCLSFSQPCSELFHLPRAPTRSLAGGMFKTPEKLCLEGNKAVERFQPYIEKPSMARKFVREFATT